ncbi:hypothetical protein V1502_10855 [Bacillus sp. SCS-153A]|uniref:hypothetical protein n=1 Tax=Rossellomorea sedimentorum TaxID=3115294 RepID=UPI003905A932
MTVHYKASKSRSQNRKSWSMMFRHPLRKDARGKRGLKVRRGLGTESEIEAEALIQQMNYLLEDESYWTLSARSKALLNFDERVVNAFYDQLEYKKNPDLIEIREKILPLPTKKEGYAKVQLIGTTGAGKTTLLRQLIGTDPEKERFPSTSTAKTTVCDMEIVLKEQPKFEAVVTFFSYEKIRMYVEECVMNCGKSYIRGETEQNVYRNFLEHTDQRFRLSYLLGNLTSKQTNTLFRRSSKTPTTHTEQSAIYVSQEDRKKLEATLLQIIDSIKISAQTIYGQIQNHLGEETEQGKEIEEKIELKFEELWKESLHYSSIVEEVMEEIEKRIALVPEGKWTYNSQDWPMYWTYAKEDRKEFIEGIKHMTSNHANYFGKLMTPLVQGIRIVGSFSPKWNSGETPKLILMDGEGLGHQAGGSISTAISKKMDEVDAILLVDNAESPMVSEPISALKHIVTSGHTSKLRIAFTHFDEVTGDNLPELVDKENHVIGSVVNAIDEIEKKLGSSVARPLGKQLEKGTLFFLGGIDKTINIEDDYTVQQLEGLIQALEKSIEETDPSETFPIYNGMITSLAIKKAADEFYKRWNSILDLSTDKSLKQHWTRVQALSRRFAELGEDVYDGLSPTADAIMMLREYLFTSIINKPVNWTAPQATEEMKQSSIDLIATDFAVKLYSFILDKMWDDQSTEWQQAYNRNGTGSTKVRARDIQTIYKNTMPEPEDLITDGMFVSEIYKLLKSSIECCDGKMEG